MRREELQELLNRYLAGECTPSQKRIVETWFNQLSKEENFGSNRCCFFFNRIVKCPSCVTFISNFIPFPPLFLLFTIYTFSLVSINHPQNLKNIKFYKNILLHVKCIAVNVNGIQRGELYFMNRRQFIGNCSLILAATQANALKASTNLQKTMLNQLKVIHTGYAVEKEKLRFPFGFKGAFLTELWQAVAYVKDLSGNYGVGLGTQSVLYGDADTFASTDETTGNSWMLEVSKTALKWLENKE